MNPGSSAAEKQKASTGISSEAGGDNGAGTTRGDQLVGRSEWRRDEHGRFMQALEMFGCEHNGDEWKKIADYVGTRSVEDVRLHGRQYLQRLVQQLPQTLAETPYLLSAGSHNAPNRSNYLLQRCGGTGKRAAGGPPGASALSAVAFEAAQSMNILAPTQFSRHLQQQQLQQLHLQQQAMIAAAYHRNGRRPTPWTFQEDKAFETALAGWTQSKPYSWIKIAEALPGKSPKDVKNRYENLVGDIFCIETGAVPTITDTATSGSAPSSSPLNKQEATSQPSSTTKSTLSRRATPPPPIDVSPTNVSKDGAVGAFTSSSRSRRGSVTMLSPTFLDMLANEAENEEKSPLPPFPALPSPLFSPSLIPLGSPGFFSPDKKSRGARAQQSKDKQQSSDDAKTERTDSISSATADKGNEPQHSSTTPRIWNDFLADDFKFDELGTPIHSSKRKTPRSKRSANEAGSSRTKTNTKERDQDVEMADASAA